MNAIPVLKEKQRRMKNIPMKIDAQRKEKRKIIFADDFASDAQRTHRVNQLVFDRSIFITVEKEFASIAQTREITPMFPKVLLLLLSQLFSNPKKAKNNKVERSIDRSIFVLHRKSIEDLLMFHFQINVCQYLDLLYEVTMCSSPFAFELKVLVVLD